MFTMVKASEVFPMRTPVKEQEKLSASHPLIPGECLLFIGETRAGVVSLSNYRIHVTCPNTRYLYQHSQCIVKPIIA